ncbi:MAG: mechanosensitive ion channel family protein [Pacificimonas sp.]
MQDQSTETPPNADDVPAEGESIFGEISGDLSIVGTLTDQLTEMARGLVATLPTLVIAIIVLIIFFFVARGVSNLAKKAASKAGERPSLVNLTQTLSKVAVWIVGILVTMTIVFPSMTLGSLVAGLGLGSVAIGFAFQDVFENFLAGILLMLREKMKIGDHIECEGISGEVMHISLRETYVRKLSNEVTIVPNSMLFKNPVEIHTDNPMRRHEITAGVSYDTDCDMARDLIQKTVEGVELVEKEKPVQVFASEFGDSSVNFTVRWWAGSKPVDMHKSRDQVVRAIKRALDDNGVEIPFPYRTLTFKEPLPVMQRDQTDTPATGD